MIITSELQSLPSVKADIIFFFIFQDDQSYPKILSSMGIDSIKDFKGKESETVLLYSNKRNSPRYCLIGLGDKKKFTLEKMRRASAIGAKKAASLKLSSSALRYPEVENVLSTSVENVSIAVIEGALLSLYKYDKYITKEKDQKPLQRISIIAPSKQIQKIIESGIKVGTALCEGTIHARDLSNAPGNEIYPATLAKDTQQLGRRLKFSVKVFDKKKIQSLGMGGVIGVSKGSANDPRFIILEYGKQFKNQGTIALVGKGVTFDTGGISIKPAAQMAEMKMDMSGAAAVIGTFHSAASLKLKRHIVGIIPSVENMPSGSAVKPGDIIRHFNKKTSEVDNTDAEGRLILADALSYVSKYSPDVVIDLATLTGACVVALGSHATGMMGNDQKIMDELKIAGESSFERVWQLPLFEEYEKQIKSDVADVKNVGGRWAGAITAGLFLKRFIGEYKWVHLDIAGTAILESDLEYIPRGGSGVGVRLLIEFMKNWKK